MNKVVVCGVAATGVQPRSEKNALSDSLWVWARGRAMERTAHTMINAIRVAPLTQTDTHTYTHTNCMQAKLLSEVSTGASSNNKADKRWLFCYCSCSSLTPCSHSSFALALLLLLLIGLALLASARMQREREREWGEGTAADDKCTKLTESCSVMKCKLRSCHLTCR